MANVKGDELCIQSYFEARTNIRDLEQRQFNAIQFFLGAFAAVLGGSVGLMQYVDEVDRPLLAISLVLISNILSVTLFFVWCALTLMINRAAAFCIDIVNNQMPSKKDVCWETWIRGDRNKSPVPYLIESTLLVFLLPLAGTFFLGMHFAGGSTSHSFLVNSWVTGVGVALLLVQYLWVLTQVMATWKGSTPRQANPQQQG